MALDSMSNFRQKLAAGEVAVRVIDLLEVVEVDEQHRELVTEAGRTIDLGLKSFIKMPGVIQASAVVGDGQFLDALDRARVIDGNGGIVADGTKEKHLAFGEAGHSHVDQLNDGEYAVL